MKIHAICLVKNESDIIKESLLSACEWCDNIFILDNGSSDGTWEIVCDLSKEFDQIVPYQQNFCLFYNALRGEVFNNYCHQSMVGDWWCRLDADEIYIDDPRIFLKKIPSKYTAVSSASFQYYFTNKDLELYNQNPSSYADDVSVHTKCRYYLNNHGELRFVRHTNNFFWEPTLAWPRNIGRFYPVRIWLKHFQYRSPQQIQKRLDIRREPSIRGEGFRHEKKQNWMDYITRNSTSQTQKTEINSNFHWETKIVEFDKLHFDAHDRNYVYTEEFLPALRTGIFITWVRKVMGYLKNPSTFLNHFSRRSKTKQYFS